MQVRARRVRLLPGQGIKAPVSFPAPFGAEIVLTESTGVYRMSACDALLEAGDSIAIANAREIRGMRWRKTGRNDADWLARAASHGSFHPSFVPGREPRGLRSLSRYATSLRTEPAGEKNRLGKLLAPPDTG